MIIRKALIGTAAVSLAFGSTAAVAAPTIDSARDASPVANAEKLGGGIAWLLALIVAAGVVVVVVADDNEEDDLPTSP